jgi:hypothetical protein
MDSVPNRSTVTTKENPQRVKDSSVVGSFVLKGTIGL